MLKNIGENIGNINRSIIGHVITSIIGNIFRSIIAHVITSIIARIIRSIVAYIITGIIARIIRSTVLCHVNGFESNANGTGSLVICCLDCACTSIKTSSPK